MALLLDTSFVIALEMARDNQHKAAHIATPEEILGVADE